MRTKISAFMIAIIFLGCESQRLSATAYAFDGYGVCATPSNKSEELVLPQVLRLLEEAGVKRVRLAFLWNEMEPEKGKYIFDKTDEWANLAKRNKIEVLGVLTRTPEWASSGNNTNSPPKNTEDWRRFVNDVVTRYKGKVKYWEIWNEPDIKKFWRGTPEEYINLLKEAYKVIKGIDPSMKVLSAGLDGNGEKYLDKLLDLGLPFYCDIIAFHPYGNTPEKSLERVKKFVSVMEKRNVKKPLWFTEIGWQSGGWVMGPGVAGDEETKALYLKQAFQLLKPYAEAIFWYRAIETPKMFGLIELDKSGKITPTPAYNAYKDMVNKR